MSRAQVGPVEIAYETTGEGPALLLVAGTGYPGATWWPPMVQQLAEQFTVIVYDHRGTGSSSAGTGRFGTRTLAQDAVGLLAALGLSQAHVIGHSMGGRVAQWIALDAPDRVLDLVLAASGPGPAPKDADRHTQGVPAPVAAAVAEQGLEAFIRSAQRRTFFTPEFCERDPERVRWLGDAFWTHRPSLQDYFQHVEARQRHDTVSRIGEIGQRTLVLVGDRDDHPGGTGSHLEQSQLLAQELPRADFVLLHDVAHGYFWQDPEGSVQAIMEWLAAGSSR